MAMRDSRIPWALVLLAALPGTLMAAERATRFREYDTRRMEALRKTAEGSGLEGATARRPVAADQRQAGAAAG